MHRLYVLAPYQLTLLLAVVAGVFAYGAALLALGIFSQEPSFT